MKIEKVEITPTEYRVTISFTAQDLRDSRGYDLTYLFKHQPSLEDMLESILIKLKDPKWAKDHGYGI